MVGRSSTPPSGTGSGGGTTRADNITIASVTDPTTVPISQSGVLPVDTATGVIHRLSLNGGRAAITRPDEGAAASFALSQRPDDEGLGECCDDEPALGVAAHDLHKTEAHENEGENRADARGNPRSPVQVAFPVP